MSAPYGIRVNGPYGEFERDRTRDVRARQLFIGGDYSSAMTGGGSPSGNTISAASGPVVTDSLLESITYIDMQGGTVNINVPAPTPTLLQNDQVRGFTKMYIMQSDGVVTIQPSGTTAAPITLRSQGESVMLVNSGTSTGGNWGPVGSQSGGVDLRLKVHPNSAPVDIGSPVVPTSPFDAAPDAVEMQVFSTNGLISPPVYQSELSSGNANTEPHPIVTGGRFGPANLYCEILGTKVSDDQRALAYWGSYRNTDGLSQIAAGSVGSFGDLLISLLPPIPKPEFTLPLVHSADGFGAFIGVNDPRNGAMPAGTQHFVTFTPAVGSHTLITVLSAVPTLSGGVISVIAAISYTNISGTPISPNLDHINVVSIQANPNLPWTVTTLLTISNNSTNRLEGTSFQFSTPTQIALCGTFTGSITETPASNPTFTKTITAGPYTTLKPAAFVCIHDLTVVGSNPNIVFAQVSSDDAANAQQFSAYGTQPFTSPSKPTAFGVAPYASAGGCVCTGMAIENPNSTTDPTAGNLFICGTGSNSIGQSISVRNGAQVRQFSTGGGVGTASTVWLAALNKITGNILYLTGGLSPQNTFSGVGYTQLSRLYSDVRWDSDSGCVLLALNVLHNSGDSTSFNFNGSTVPFQASTVFTSETMMFRIYKDTGRVKDGNNIDSLATNDNKNVPISSLSVGGYGAPLVASHAPSPAAQAPSSLIPFGWVPTAQPYAALYPAGPYGFLYGNLVGPASSIIVPYGTFAPTLSVGPGPGGGQGFRNQGIFTDTAVTLQDLRNICGGGLGPSVLPLPSTNARLIYLDTCAYWCPGCVATCGNIAAAGGGLSVLFPNVIYACVSFENTDATYSGTGAGVAADMAAFSALASNFCGAGPPGPGYDNTFCISDFGTLAFPNGHLITPYITTGAIPTSLYIDPGTMQIVWETYGFNANEQFSVLSQLTGPFLGAGQQPSTPPLAAAVNILSLNRWLTEDIPQSTPSIAFTGFAPIAYIDTNRQGISYISFTSKTIFQMLSYATTLPPIRLAVQRGAVGVVMSTPDLSGYCSVRFNATVLKAFSTGLSPGLVYDIDRNGALVPYNSRSSGSSRTMLAALNSTDVLLIFCG